MKNPTLTDVTRRAYEAGEFYSLSQPARVLLLYGLIRVWNERKRPPSFPCRQDVLTGCAGMSLTSFKNARNELFEHGLIDWKLGVRNTQSAVYSLGSWFYADHEPDYELDPDSDCDPDPYNRGRERGREEISPSRFKKAEYSEDFLKFWEVYPRKKGKKDAFRAWPRAIEETDLETILKAVESQTRSKQWQEPKYIPHPSTWLNQGRWEDVEDERPGVPDQF